MRRLDWHHAVLDKTRCCGPQTHPLRLVPTVGATWLRGSEIRTPWRSRTTPFSLRRALLPLSLAAIALAAAASFWNAPSAPLAGRAYAVDGDTLGIGETRIRIVGIDAPELDQSCTGEGGDAWPCGREARSFLVALIAGSEVSCLPEGRDRYGRTLARCTVGERDVAGEIVSAGWALAEAGYAGDQVAARSARAGIWAGRFEAPSQWRREQGERDSTVWDWIRSWFG